MNKFYIPDFGLIITRADLNTVKSHLLTDNIIEDNFNEYKRLIREVENIGTLNKNYIREEGRRFVHDALHHVFDGLISRIAEMKGDLPEPDPDDETTVEWRARIAAECNGETISDTSDSEVLRGASTYVKFFAAYTCSYSGVDSNLKDFKDRWWHRTLDWQNLDKYSPEICIYMMDIYRKLQDMLLEFWHIYEHNDVFCKNCRIRRISNAIWKHEIFIETDKEGRVCAKIVHNGKIMEIKLDEDSNKIHLFPVHPGFHYEPNRVHVGLRDYIDPFVNVKSEDIFKIPLEQIANRLDLVLLNSDQIPRKASEAFYEILGMNIEDDEICILSPQDCSERQKCKDDFLSNGMYW